MDIPAIEAFLTVARLNSFSLAAGQLFITQPAISKRIATLEAQLGVKLFDRIQRKVILTEAGKVFLPGAQRISEAVRESKNSIACMNETITGELCIATSHHIGLHRLPPILKNYVSQYPQVDINIDFMDSESALLAVEKAQIELAIITLPGKPALSIKTHLVWDDPLAVVVGNSHPLLSSNRTATQKSSGKKASAQQIESGKSFMVDAEQLCRYSAILPDKGTFTREIVDQYFTDRQIDYQVKLSSNYLETIKMMVSVGLGWSVLPESMLDKNLQTLNIQQFDVCRSLGIAYHTSRTLSQPAQKMFELITKVSNG